MKKLALIGLISLIGLIGAGPVGAQTVIKITAIPPRLELEAPPGEVITRQLKVKNEGDSQIALEVKVQDFIVADNEGTPVPVEEETADRWAASRWINVSPQKLVLNPGETKALDFVAVIPEEAAPGGHYAIVFYSPVGTIGATPEGELTGQTSIAPNVGTLVYFTVPGDVQEDARVLRFQLPRWVEYGPIKITTEIENLSDLHIKPLGTIRIYDMFGRLITTLKLEEKNIFPGTSRVYQNTWEQKWGLGKYKAQLNAGYGTQGKALVATAFFWIIPWRVITIALLTVVLAILLIIYWRKPKPVKEKEKTKL